VYNGTEHTLDFLVLSGCSPDIIFGRTALRQFGLLPTLNLSHSLSVPCNSVAPVEKIENDFAWINVIDTDAGKRLECSMPLLEHAWCTPLHEPPRTSSRIMEEIKLLRLRDMENDSMVSECDAHRIKFLVPIVVVDKKNHLGIPKILDETVHDRYRITSDLRGVNKMKLVQMESGRYSLISSSIGEVQNDKKKKEEKEFFLIVQSACGIEQIMDIKVMTQ
jgi:hypothetical protein